MPILLLLILALIGAEWGFSAECEGWRDTRHAPCSLQRRPAGLTAVAACCSCCRTVAAPLAQDTHLLVITGVGGDDEHAKAFQQVGDRRSSTPRRKHGMADANITYLGEKPEQSGGRIEGALDARERREGVRAISRRGPKRRRGVHRPHRPRQLRRTAGRVQPARARSHRRRLRGAARRSFRRSRSCSSTRRARAARSCSRWPGPAARSSPRRRPAASATRRASRSTSSRRSTTDAADRDRNGRVSVQEAFDYAQQKVKAAYEQEGHILTEHATLDDGNQGKLAATLFLAPERSRTAAAQAADPALRALLEQRDALERRSRRCGCGRTAWTRSNTTSSWRSC